MLTKVAHGPSLSEKVYHELRSAIMDGRLKSGAPIVIEQVAVEMGISPTPVREALAQLGQEGFVEKIPYRGTRVASINREEWLHILQVRAQLEPLAIALAINIIPEEEITDAISRVQQLQANVLHGDPLAYLESNRLVHALAPSHCGNPILAEIVEMLERKVARFLVEHQDPLSTVSHMEILEAYRARDLEKAVELMTAHLGRFGQPVNCSDDAN